MGLLTSFCLLGSGFGSILVGELLLHFEYQSVFSYWSCINSYGGSNWMEKVLILYQDSIRIPLSLR